MYDEMTIMIMIGLVLSLVIAEITGLSPGGLVVPGYLAIYYKSPQIIAVIILISILTYLMVTKVISKVMIIYGKRKFTAMLLVAILFKLAMDLFIQKGIILDDIYYITGIGLILPGLIANNAQKEGWLYTSLMIFVVTGLTVTVSTFFI